MRVLISRRAGFIGSTVVVGSWPRGGHEIVGLDAYIPQAHGPSPDHDPEGVLRLDVRDAARWTTCSEGVDVRVPPGGHGGCGGDGRRPAAYAAHNDLGTAALLAAMAARDVRRLVLAASMVVYGEGRYGCEEHGASRPRRVRRRAGGRRLRPPLPDL